MSLTTVPEVREYLDICDDTYDSQLTSMVEYVDGLIKGCVGWNIEQEVIVDEAHWSDGCLDTFYLHFCPIDLGQTFEVYFDGTLMDASRYEVNDVKGIVQFDCPIGNGFTKLKFNYTGGYLNVPADLSFAAMSMVIDLWESSGGGSTKGLASTSSTATVGTVSSESLGDYSVSYVTDSTTNTSTGTGIDTSALVGKHSDVFNKYRRTRI